jgi:hypothetical protein
MSPAFVVRVALVILERIAHHADAKNVFMT